MEADPRQNPNRAAGARQVERSLVPWRDAERRPAKRKGKRTEQADAGRARALRQDGATHA